MAKAEAWQPPSLSGVEKEGRRTLVVGWLMCSPSSPAHAPMASPCGSSLRRASSPYPPSNSHPYLAFVCGVVTGGMFCTLVLEEGSLEIQMLSAQYLTKWAFCGMAAQRQLCQIQPWQLRGRSRGLGEEKCMCCM